MLGYFVSDSDEPDGFSLSPLSPAQRTGFALAAGEKLHPQYRAEFENAFSISWKVTRFSEGANARYATPEDRTRALRILGEADGPIYYAGEHVSWLSGWIAGAFESALRAVKLIHSRVVA